MNDTRMTIVLGDREIILIGTAHVSRESIDEVRQAIRKEKPQQVCVELDPGRYAAIIKQDNWESLDMVKVFREGKGFLLIANLVLSGFQRRMGAELGVKPGEEMKTALETAGEMGIPHSLCDREVQITLRRAWAACGFWNKAKLLGSLLSGAVSTEKMSAEEIEGLKNNNELGSMMAELSDYLPQVKETLIDERDRYLAAKIWDTASKIESPVADSSDPAPFPRKKIVAVVGAGHMGGIRSHLEKIAAREEDVDVSALDRVPAPSFFSRALGFLIPALIVGLIVFGFFRAGAQASLSMVLRWVLWNGSLAALGALIALAHPLAILISFIGAPVATINPFIGVGLFSGVAQAALRKPRVGDAQKITEDIGSLKGIYRNRITHALLVFFLSSIGAAAGNFISIPSLAGVLFQ